MERSSTITASHLARTAVIYVRQSSPHQVQHHQGSQEAQRALATRAQALGWHSDQIQVLDADLGLSAAQAAGRADFTALTAQVALGKIGIIFGWDVSRLARNNADWYQLLDLAALMATLIADAEGVYDPQHYNDRLLLGLKGAMSEAELHLMRQRLAAGRLSTVHRGEYRQNLPTGLVRLPEGGVVKDPDTQVRHVLEMLFAKFAELGSGQKVLRYCAQHAILLPRRQGGEVTGGAVQWKKASAGAIYAVLRNPAYAGAFVYGRSTKEPTRCRPGRPATGRVLRPQADWLTIQQGAYPAYISWEAYVANQEQLRDNAQRHRQQCQPPRGAVRPGVAVLPGLARCGACGHVLQVSYRAAARYDCDGMSADYAESICPSFHAATVDALVIQAFCAAIHPAQVDALEALRARQRTDHARLVRAREEQRQRAAYDAQLARRRYEAVDPENRLVAGELERRWEEALHTVHQSEEAVEQARQDPAVDDLDPLLRQELEQLAQRLPDLWARGQLPPATQKDLLRSLISSVILTRPQPDRVEVTVVWVSGHASVLSGVHPTHRQRDLPDGARLLARVHALWQAGHTDQQAATILTQEGYHSARSRHISLSIVSRLRQEQGWTRVVHHPPRADLDAQDVHTHPTNHT